MAADKHRRGQRQSGRHQRMTRWAFEQRTGCASSKLVLVALADAASDNDGTCFVGEMLLTERTELSLRTVRDALKSLEEQGLIKRMRRYRQGGYRTTDLIELCCTGLPAAGAGEPVEKAGSLAANGDSLTGKRRQSFRQRLPGKLNYQEQPLTTPAPATALHDGAPVPAQSRPSEAERTEHVAATCRRLGLRLPSIAQNLRPDSPTAGSS
jgi:hypothetical protein